MGLGSEDNFAILTIHPPLSLNAIGYLRRSHFPRSRISRTRIVYGTFLLGKPDIIHHRLTGKSGIGVRWQSAPSGNNKLVSFSLS
jgi:hypothetical protein